MILDQFINLKYKYGNSHFWAREFFADTVGKNTKMIQEYIQNQLFDDKLADQMSMKEFIDPFTEEKSSKRRQIKWPLEPTSDEGAFGGFSEREKHHR